MTRASRPRFPTSVSPTGLLVVVFAVRRVVRIAPHLRVDVPLRQPLVVAGEVPHESLVLAGPELAVRVRAPENFADLPVGADLIDRHPVDVLGGHVGSSLGERHAVDEPLLGAGEHRRALDQLVAVEREHPPSTVSPGAVPARPTRWSSAATDFGDPTCTTRSRCGMSIPSSRLVDVVTTSSVPAFSPSSIRVRWASPRLPW